MRYLFLSLFISSLLTSNHSSACTGVEIGTGEQVSVGQNVGWFWKMDAALVANKRGVSKFGVKNDEADVPAQWTSQYGSVSLVTVGREFPISGVNEKGLTVQGLHSYDGRYETTSGLPALGEFQWIQYQLDLSANIEDAISNAKLVRPTDNPQLTLHFLICEASGRCATFQWLNGKMEVRTDEALPIKAFTNSEYSKSVLAYEKCSAQNCNPPDDPPLFSLKRFTQAAKLAKAYDNVSDPVKYLFGLLDTVKQPVPLASWSLVIHNGVLHLSAPGGDKIQFVDLKTLNFSCAQPAQMQLIDLSYSGNSTSRFKDYDPELQKLLGQESKGPPEKQKQWLEYPDQTVCVAP